MATEMSERLRHYNGVEKTLRDVGLNPTPQQINRLVDGMLDTTPPLPDKMPNKCSNCGEIDWLVAYPCEYVKCPCTNGVCRSCERSITKNLGRP